MAASRIHLGVPEAPESGLLTFVGDSYVEGEQGNPPVSVCYEVGGEFSLEHEERIDYSGIQRLKSISIPETNFSASCLKAVSGIALESPPDL
ncbi:hypothetical protein GCM10022205_03500 [Spinactinospora alkalitolerans]